MFNFIQSLEKFKLPFFSTFDICLDLGTSNTRIAIKDKGKVLNEPTYVGVNTSSKEYIFFGSEAKTILGKTPEFIKIIRPVINGVISDFDAQVALLHKFLQRSVKVYFKNFTLIKPQLRAIASVPYSATEIEQKALEEVLFKVGFSSTYLVEKPIATAIGAGVNIFYHHPHLLIDIGGGLVELSIVSGGGIVAERTIKNAGDSLNHTLANYVYLKYGIILGETTCEHLKIYLLNFRGENRAFTVRGKSLEDGLPKSVRIKSSDVKEALYSNISQIFDGVKELIEVSPPEVVDEIYERGITLTGGLANVEGIDNFLSDELKIDVVVASDPDDAVIRGLLKLSNNYQDLVKLSIPKI
ncbi:rod shape-determining protein [Candidatus Roizmanbacteria bacterium]|nr:rod shape-determining protein [Candidatus Roizmanbacteria bacterium]